MKTVKYQIKLNGLKTSPGTISIFALKNLTDILIENSERALRLAVEGHSLKKGKLPEWLRKAVDFNLTSVGEGSTVLNLEAPKLKEVATEQIAQQNLWIELPEPNDTALSIWAKSFSDATSEKYESEMYDSGLLSSFIGFKDFINNYADSIEISSKYDKKINNFKIDNEHLERIQKLKASIPESRKIMVSGVIDVIEHQSGRFKLQLESGEKIQGEIDKKHLNRELMRNYWGEKVTIRAIADYRPDSKIRYLKADLIKPFQVSEKIFEDYLVFEEPRDIVYKISKRKSVVSPLKEIWGKWPGDESIDEILSELE